MKQRKINYVDERFADVQMLRYQLERFEELTLKQKILIYCLSKATLYGRDITFDQFGKYNLRIRKALECIYTSYSGNRSREEFIGLTEYLKRVWFSNGIYHHYGCEKFSPTFSESFFKDALLLSDYQKIGFENKEKVEEELQEICPVIFNASLFPKRVNKAAGEDIILSSACNYYQGVCQAEVERFYNRKKMAGGHHRPISYGLNSTLIKTPDGIKEEVWRSNGKYGKAIAKVVEWLDKAIKYAENEQQARVIRLLIDYYTTGNLSTFDEYSVEWLKEQDGRIDFINGFIEVYGDPLGLKGSWEGIVEYKDLEATCRTQTISKNAQWFEDHSPVDPRFRKSVVKGVTAHVICAAMLGGDEYPSSAIGINLPNADWIRAEYGSKSVTISNLTRAYSKVANGNGFREEFVINSKIIDLIDRYGNKTDELHTDLHECLGHGSGRLLPGVSSDALKNYGNTIEEARADLFGLYYIADEKLIELGLLDDAEAYKAQYYVYMMNGLLTQMVRIEPDKQIEESHMQNRALITRWAYDLGKETNVIELVGKTEESDRHKTFVRINDYSALRAIFAQELAEIQRIKSEGDFEAAKLLVEKYGIHIDSDLHSEILARYKKLDIAPYKGFINPRLTIVYDAEAKIADVVPDYTESYEHQMLRYSQEYGTL